MKYCSFYIVLILLIACSFASKGQCPSDKRQFDIIINQGFITGDQLADQVKANDNASAGSGGKSETYNSGATFITVRYFLYNRLAFGFAGGINNVRGQYTDSYHPSLIISTYKQSNTTIAAEFYYIYFFRKYLEVYTFLGVGPSFTTTTTAVDATLFAPATTVIENRDELKLQYTPIGIRLGGRIGGFAELGIGYKGIFNAGISVKLGPSCWWKM
jgi:outer membrane protein W